MITTTATGLITSAMRLIGVLASEELPKASELQDGLACLNALIDEWGVHRMTMQANATYTFPLVVDQQAYTIGELGDFTIAPPLSIDELGLQLPTDVTSPPVEIPISLVTQQLYASIQIKELTSSYPTSAYYDRTTPDLATLWLWPIPQQTDLNLVLYTPVYLEQFSNLTVEVSLSEGYYKTLRYNLALELIPEYSAPFRQDIADIAAKALKAIKVANLVMTDLSVDPGIQAQTGSSYNVLTDTGA